MRLFLIGERVNFLPDLPEASEIYLGENHNAVVTGTGQTILEWAIEQLSPVVLVVKDAALIDEEYLDEVTEVVQHEKYADYMADVARKGDVVLMSWDDERYDQLDVLCRKEVGVLDMADNYKRLVIEEPQDTYEMVKTITAKVTADVLAIVRAEMQDMLRSRRYRGKP